MGCTNIKLVAPEPWQSNIAEKAVEMKTVTTPVSEQNEQRRHVQNFVVVCFYSSFDRLDVSDQNSIINIREIVDSTEVFTELDSCIDFIEKSQKEKLFLIVSNSMVGQLPTILLNLSQIILIYVVNDDKIGQEQCTPQHRKIRGRYNKIIAVCNQLKMDAKQLEQSLAPISILAPIDVCSESELNRLDPLFMYTQILKELIIDMNFDETAKCTFVDFCRLQYRGNIRMLEKIENFAKNDDNRCSIWWYTCPMFLYEMLNRALRLPDVEIIWKMGFFIKDLHKRIEQIHSASASTEKIVVYRGQGMSHDEFDILRRRLGGLLSFNSFISTSTDRLVSIAFTYGALNNPHLVPILFEMEVDPSVRTSPFASINNLSYFPTECEILFSMHSIFRIKDIKSIENGIWQVDLCLTNDNDVQLRQLSLYMRNELQQTEGFERLAKLMFEMGELEKATEHYQTFIEATDGADKQKLARLYSELGFIWNVRRNYDQALLHNEKALDLYRSFLPPDHPQVATIYTNIGYTLREMGELESALDYHYRALNIKLNASEPNQKEIAASYGNIGEVFRNQGRLDEALLNFQQCLKAELECLPTNHPSLAFTHYSIGLTYDNQGDHVNALFQFKQCMLIQKKSLPPHHSAIADSYGNMAKALQSLHRYDDALQYAEKAVDIAAHNFPSDHPELLEKQALLNQIHQNL